MKGLIKNELIKTYKTGFIKAALCLILALAVLLPVFNVITTRIEEEMVNSFSTIAEEESSTAGKAYYKTLASIDDFFNHDKKSDADNWKYDEFYGSLLSLEMSKTILTLIKSGEEKDDIENFFSYEELNSELEFDEKNILVSSTEDNYKSVFELKPDEVDKKLAQTEEMLKKLKTLISEATIHDLYKRNAENSAADIVNLKNDLKEAEEALAKSPESDGAAYKAKQARAQLESAELQHWGTEYLLKNNVEYASWQYYTITDLLYSAAYSYSDLVLMSKEIFLKSENRHAFQNYDEYVKFIDVSTKSTDEAVALIKYSLEKNIPLPESTANSSRESFLDDSSFIAVVVGILMVAIASTTMFNEYATGSIRLLLIRPKSRGKILLSKLITVIIYGIAAMAVSLVILFVLNLVTGENKDMFTPYLLMDKGDRIIEIAPVLYVLANIAAKLFSAFVIVAGAFMLSSVFTKGGIFALTAGAACMCLASLAKPLCSSVNSSFKGALSYTVLPYLNLSQYIGNSVADVSYNNYSMIDALFGSAADRIQFNPVIGTVIVAVHIAAFLIIAFSVFRKKQIKN